MTRSNEAPSPETPRQRLEALMKTGRIIPYLVDNPDRQHPQVRWCIYGAPDTNEIFVSVTDGTLVFVRSARSILEYPPMCDRIFGIDVCDMNEAGRLSMDMWRDHGDALCRGA